MLTYTRQPNGSFTRSGAVRSRYVYIEVLRNGVWSERLAPVRHAYMQMLIEEELKVGAPHLRGEAYRLTDAPSRFSDADRERLKALRSKRFL